ncbi:DUF2809 domain-containing protein [Paenibacillus xerothermodurans]|uniref:ribosomal maturation YjgA family protein n=1 Tax=Paenibacillus xerothermodurans TaxID=1977292 RepID=UPI001FB5488F|nr:DUF2809 domain-containing protein [Paenibacillus xerothermodurans]
MRLFFYSGRRVLYLAAASASIVSGLASRYFSAFLPKFIAVYAGDAIWASMIYFGFRAISIRTPLHTAALASFLFSVMIEFSQLYQAGWINELRATLLGALVLGKGFVTQDLARYSFGIAAAYLLDVFLLSCYSKRNATSIPSGRQATPDPCRHDPASMNK